MNQTIKYTNIIFTKIKALLADDCLTMHHINCLEEELCNELARNEVYGCDYVAKLQNDNKDLKIVLKHLIKTL